MRGLAGLYRVRTAKHVRTSRSIPSSTGSGRRGWSRIEETARLAVAEERLKWHRLLHEDRRAR